jgi:hypothetical protein
VPPKEKIAAEFLSIFPRSVYRLAMQDLQHGLEELAAESWERR